MQTKQQRLSFSTFDLIHSCERLYQLEKLLEGGSREESEHLSFGTAFGAAIAEYLYSQDADKAIWQLFLAYTPLVESDKKNLPRCVQAFLACQSALDNLLEEYELVQFQGRPATELSFRLNIDEDYYYVGYIDAVLRNRYTGKYVVFECKTTGMGLLDLSPLYKHSGQALGYSIVLDKIVGQELSSYGVLYFVCQLGKDFATIKPHILPFHKTLLDRLNWFIVLGLDVQHLHQMQNLQIYPRRYTSCLKFNKPCRHFGTCHMHSFDKPKEQEPDTIEYQFVYDLNSVVEDHLRRLAACPELAERDASERDASDLADSAGELGAGAGDIIDLDAMDFTEVKQQKVLSSPPSDSKPVTSAPPVFTPPVGLTGKEKLAAILAAKKAAKA